MPIAAGLTHRRANPQHPFSKDRRERKARRSPSRSSGQGDDPGRVTTGYYTLADDILTVTDSSGRPIRKAAAGERFTCKVKPGDNHVAFAGQMTLEIRGTMRGENAPGAVKGFGRELDYPKSGWVDVRQAATRSQTRTARPDTSRSKRSATACRASLVLLR